MISFKRTDKPIKKYTNTAVKDNKLELNIMLEKMKLVYMKSGL